MIEQLIFYSIGLLSLYAVYKLVKKEFCNSQCSSCPFRTMCHLKAKSSR